MTRRRIPDLGKGQTTKLDDTPEPDPRPLFARETASGLLVVTESRPVGFTDDAVRIQMGALR